MSRLAIIGYGKMGRMIAALAPEYDFEVALTLDLADSARFTAESFAGIDAAIEFTAPEAAAANLERLAALRVPTVCGTTGWFARLAEIRAAFDAAATPLIYSANYSVGVNLFERIVAQAARLMQGHPDYESWAWEIHHSAKLDAPSGTLLKLTAAMRDAGYTRRIDESSSRAGKIPGTHEIGFDSAADTITLRHTARSREGFARGALHAARWLAGPGKTKPVAVREFREILFGGE